MEGVRPETERIQVAWDDLISRSDIVPDDAFSPDGRVNRRYFIRTVRSLVDGLIDEDRSSDRSGHTPPSTERNKPCVERRHDVKSRKTSKANRKNALPNR